MRMTDEDLDRLEECWLEEQTYLANGGNLGLDYDTYEEVEARWITDGFL